MRQVPPAGSPSFGSSGTGTVPHMRFEMLKLLTGVEILHVRYRAVSSPRAVIAARIAAPRGKRLD